MNRIDPSGLSSSIGSIDREGWEHYFEKIVLSSLKTQILDTARRHNNPQWTNMNNEAFAAMLGAKIVMEDAYWTAISEGRLGSRLKSYLPSLLNLDQINWVERNYGQISWGIMNIPTHLGNETLNWWDNGGYFTVENNRQDFQSLALDYDYGVWQGTDELRMGIMISELEHNDRAAVEYMGVAMMFSAYESTTLNQGQASIYLRNGNSCKVIYPRQRNEISAHIIASGVVNVGDALSPATYGLVYDFNLDANRTQGSSDNWIGAIPYAADLLGLKRLEYLDYTSYEKEGLGIQ